MSDRLATLRLFARVARRGSFSAAARELGLSQPSASRAVAELEREIGAALLVRTTRAVTLTEAGEDYLARIEPILTALDEADHAARGGGELRGVLRVAASSSFTTRVVVPALPAFAAAHPQLRVDLRLSDSRQDLVVEGVDLALRIGALADSIATARKLGESNRTLVASPAYLARAGMPAAPADLAAHAILQGPPDIPAANWTFRRNGKALSTRVIGRFAVNVHEALVAAAVAGLGIAGSSDWGCRRELATGELVRLLPDWEMDPVEVHAVFPVGRAAAPAARAFAEFLAQVMREWSEA